MKLHSDLKSLTGTGGHTLAWLLILLVTCTFPLNAQKSSAKADAETLKLINGADDSKGKQSGALIVLKDYRMTINKKGLSTIVVRIVGKVYTKEAMGAYSQIPLGFNSYSEDAHLDLARIIHKDGTVTDVKKDAVQVKSSPEAQGLQYTDYKYLSFGLSGLEPGSAFEYKATVTQKIPVIEGEWFDNHWFVGMLRNLSPPYTPRIDPVLTSVYTLVVPKGTKFQYHISINSREPVKTTLKDEDVYQWTMSDLPELKIEEGMPSISKLSPVLIITSLKEWSQLDEWATRKILSKVEVTQAVVDKAKEITASTQDESEKIKLISHFVQNNIQYLYADLERGGYTPHSPDEILSSRYGDCKDQTILFISLLKAVGIIAYPALINPSNYDEYTVLPAPYFSHLIAYIPSDKQDKWLDMTSHVTPFPELFFPDKGRTAFIINGTGGRLTTTPIRGTTENISNFSLQTSIEKTTGKATFKIETRGNLSEILKLVFIASGQEKREELFKKLVNSYVDAAVIDNISFSDIQNPEEPFQVSISYHLDNLWNENEGDLSFGSHALIPLSLLANLDDQAVPTKRFNDLVREYQLTFKGSETYNPPTGDLLPVMVPSNDSISNDFYSFKRSFAREGKSITANWILNSYDTVIPKEKYISFPESIKALRSMANWTIRYVDPFYYARKVFQSDSPNNILAYTKTLLDRDSTNILALLLRGIAYDRLQRRENSISTFQQALRLDPQNKYAHIWIASALKASDKGALALQHITQAIRIDPKFFEAYLMRGALLMTQGQSDRAIADFDQAYKLDTTNTEILQIKATILTQLGRNHEALSSYMKMAEIDSTQSSVYSMMAEIYITMKKYNKAIEMYFKAIKNDGNNPVYFGNLGWAYYLANDDDKCIAYSNRAVALNPETYYAKYNIALANLRSGNIGEARKLYEGLKNMRIPYNYIIGARKDLNDLIAKGIFVEESKAILKEFF